MTDKHLEERKKKRDKARYNSKDLLKNAENVPRRGRVRFLTLDVLDKRSKAYKDTITMMEAMASDLGGLSHITKAQQQMIQRASVMGAMLESIETEFLDGQGMELKEYLPLANAQRRMLETLGLKRVQLEKDVSLTAYVAKKDNEGRPEAYLVATDAKENPKDDDIGDGDTNDDAD